MPTTDTSPQKILASDPKRKDATQPAPERIDWVDMIEQAHAGREMGRKLRNGRSPIANEMSYH